MDKRTLKGIANRYVNSENFIVKEYKVLISSDENSAKHKSEVVARKITERGVNAFVNPRENGYEVVISS